ncbi:MAG: hypothetical protein RDU89_04540 [bacterium]|nr:hypothetical protein [bacterium]
MGVPREADQHRVRRVIGGILGLVGLVILLRAVPPGLWLAVAGAALLYLGYVLVYSPGGAKK